MVGNIDVLKVSERKMMPLFHHHSFSLKDTTDTTICLDFTSKSGSKLVYIKEPSFGKFNSIRAALEIF